MTVRRSVIAGDGSTPPPDSANSYQPSACPGAPHAWLADHSSLFDHFGVHLDVAAAGCLKWWHLESCRQPAQPVCWPSVGPAGTRPA